METVVDFFSIENKVKSILSDVLEIDRCEISQESRLTHDLGGDSLDAAEIAARLIQQLGVTTISQKQIVADIERVETVGEIIQKVQVFLKRHCQK